MLTLRIVLIVSLISIVQSLSCRYQKCSYFGDPHLIGYGSSTQYWCKNRGWELLNGNAYVNVYVNVGPSPYLITDYVITFPGVNPCVLYDGALIPLSPATTCGSTTPVTTFVVSPGTRWMHFHKTQCIIVDVTKRWGYFDIHIYQSGSLVGSTKGVCVKRNCTLESSWTNPKPVIVDICNVFIANAQKNLFAKVGSWVITAARMSCVNDIQLTFNVQHALQSIDLIFRQSILSKLNGTVGIDQGIFRKMDSAAKTAISNAIINANQIIRRSEDVCDRESQACLRPFEDTVTSQTPAYNSTSSEETDD